LYAVYFTRIQRKRTSGGRTGEEKIQKGKEKEKKENTEKHKKSPLFRQIKEN